MQATKSKGRRARRPVRFRFTEPQGVPANVSPETAALPLAEIETRLRQFLASPRPVTVEPFDPGKPFLSVWLPLDLIKNAANIIKPDWTRSGFGCPIPGVAGQVVEAVLSATQHDVPALERALDRATYSGPVVEVHL